jgi:hypothetical protein
MNVCGTTAGHSVFSPSGRRMGLSSVVIGRRVGRWPSFSNVSVIDASAGASIEKEPSLPDVVHADWLAAFSIATHTVVPPSSVPSEAWVRPWTAMDGGTVAGARLAGSPFGSGVPVGGFSPLQPDDRTARASDIVTTDSLRMGSSFARPAGLQREEESAVLCEKADARFFNVPRRSELAAGTDANLACPRTLRAVVRVQRGLQGGSHLS